MNKDAVFLGLDCGGSSTECVAVSGGGDLLAVHKAGPANPLSAGEKRAAHSVRTAIEGCLKEIPFCRVAAVHVGSAEEELSLEADYLSFLDQFPQVTISSDVYAAWAGAGPLKSGTLVASGTGSLVLTITKNGEKIRRGGWGFLLGDEGSAFAIGIKALQAVLAAWEIRQWDVAFCNRLRQHLKIKRIDDLWRWVYRQPVPRDEIAALSRLVDDLALQGDQTALDILSGSAQQLAFLVDRAIPEEPQGPVWFTGGVFRSSWLTKEFARHLRGIRPELILQCPKFPTSLGSALLAYRSLYPAHVWVFSERLSQNLKKESGEVFG